MNYITGYSMNISEKNGEKPDFNYKDFTDEKINGYIHCNEDSGLVREKIEALKPEKIGGICSGGDIVILSLLSSGAYVTGLDISYDSIAAAMLKTLMLKNYKSDEIKNSILKGEISYCMQALMEFMDYIPKDLKNHVNTKRISDIDEFADHWYEFKYNWDNTPNYVLDSAREKIGNLTLIHENLKNIKNHGTFDTIYASNAMHYGRIYCDRKEDVIDSIEDNGHIITVDNKLLDFTEKHILNLIEEESSCNPITWTYFLYQKNKKTARTAP